MTKFNFDPDPSWLETLSPLDDVYLSPSCWGSRNESPISVAKIERITKTQIVLTNGSRFKRSNGSQVEALTKGKRPARISPYSQENKNAVAEYRLKQDSIAHIESVNLYKLPIDKLVAIVKLLNQDANGGAIA